MSLSKDQANFALIRQRVTMQMLLDHYGIKELSKAKDELRGKCPLPGCSQGARSFQVNTVKNIFHCFACQAGGNVIDFVAKKERCNVREAGLKIQEWFLTNDQTSTPPAEPPEEPRADQQRTEHDTHERKQVIFHCPNRCGGQLRKKVTFYLTSEPAFEVHGKCDQCGAYGFAEIPLDKLFSDAPTHKTVQ